MDQYSKYLNSLCNISSVRSKIQTHDRPFFSSSAWNGLHPFSSLFLFPNLQVSNSKVIPSFFSYSIWMSTTISRHYWLSS